MENLTGYQWSTLRTFNDRPEGASYRVKMKGVVPEADIVDTPKKAKRLLDRLYCADYVALDTEFDTADNNRMLSWQVSDGECRTLILPDLTYLFKDWLLKSNIKKVFQHARADFPIFRALGCEIGGFGADTMVMDWLIDENRDSHGLKAMCFDWLDLPMTDFKDAFGVEVPTKNGKKTTLKIPPLTEVIKTALDRYVEYSTLDSYGTYWLFQHHKTILERLYTSPKKDENFWQMYQKYDLPFTLTLARMVDFGLAIDVDMLEQIGIALDRTMICNRHVFTSMVPPVRIERVSKGQKYIEVKEPESINLNSHQQLAAIFYDELGCSFPKRRNQKARTTDATQLEQWAAEGVLPAKVLSDYRDAAKLRTTFVGKKGGKGLLSHVRQVTDRYGTYYWVTTDLKQIGTDTGRLASAAPNLQNIPKSDDTYRIRRAFRARRGCKLIVGDYSTIELRVLAHLSKDRLMCEALNGGRDLHAVTAKNIWKLKCAEKEVKTLYPDLRNKAKGINFGVNYGMQAPRLSDTLKISKAEAQRYIDAYFDMYSGVYYWMQKTIAQCRACGYVRTLLGRRRRLPEINLSGDENFGKRGHAERQAINTPIQGSVADIMKLAMNKLDSDAYLAEREARLLLQVHDELIIECPEIDAHQVRDHVKKVMETIVKLRVPIPTEIGIGDTWEDAKV